MSDLAPDHLPTPADAMPDCDAAGAIIEADGQPDALPRETMAAFVEALAQWGNVRVAAAQVGMSRAHLYRLRRASSDFRLLWDAALVLARPQVEEVLADRALNGVQEVVFYHGEEVAVRTRYDARLLLAHLGRLDRVANSGMTWKAVEDFDARVAQFLAPPDLYDWDDEDYGEDYGEDDGEDGDYAEDEDYVEDGDYGEDEAEDAPDAYAEAADGEG